MLRSVIDTYKRSFSGLSRETWMLATVILINRCGYMAAAYMSLYVTQHLGHSEAAAGLIIAIFGAGSIAGAAAGGALSDRIGYRPVQVGALVTGGAFFLVFAFVTHFVTLCVLSFIISFFTEAFRPANFAATHAYAKPGTNTRSYALNRLAMNIGWAIGSGLGGILASFNYQLLFLVEGVVTMSAGITLLLLLPPGQQARKTDAPKATPAGTYRRPWQDPIFLRFMAITTLFATCFFLMFRVAPLFFKTEWGMSERIIGLLLGLNGVVIALVEMVLIARLEKSRAPLQFTILGTVFLSASYLFLAVPASLAVTGALVSMLLFTIGEMFALPFINTFVISRAGPGNRGQYAAGYTLCWSVAQVLGPVGGLLLAGRYGYTPLWILLSVLLCACAWGYHILHKKAQQEAALLAPAL